MKKIYSFTVNKSQEVEELIESTNEAGQQVITKNKVTKLVPQKYAVIKMTRSMKDDADFFYGKQYGYAINNGMIPVAILSKRFDNDDGIFSEKTIEKVKKMTEEFLELSKKLAELKNKEVKDEADASLEKQYNDSVKSIQNELRDIEVKKNSFFANTAEVWARNKAIIWWLLFLSYSEDASGNLTPFFKGSDHKSKLEDYDKYYENEDPFFNEIINNFLNVVSIYYSTGVSVQTEIDNILKEINDPAATPVS